MQIEKNIAATLRHRMEAEKKSKLEFSKELGIPRSTFQGYLKGENCLRSDSIEEIAKGLNITPAQLISGPEDAAAESLRLETLLPQIPALHPQAQRLAKDAIALLQTAFRVSQELMCIDAHASEQDAPEGAYRYFLQETWQPARMRCSYGLLGQQRQSGCWTTLAVISPFSDDRAAVERLAPSLHHPAARPRPPVRRHPRLPRPGSRIGVNAPPPNLRSIFPHPRRSTKKAHPSGWAFFVNIAAGPGRKNKIVTQQSGHDFEARSRRAGKR